MGQAVLDEGEREQRVTSMLAVFSPKARVAEDKLRWSKARVGKDAATALSEVASCGGVAIDFTTAKASAQHARMAAEAGCSFVCGTTGLSEREMLSLRDASEQGAVVYASNFSLGVALLSALVERAASLLSGDAFDAEIFEMHHREKKDAPSGTALRLGEAVVRGRGERVGESRGDRGGVRARGEVGYGVLRGGGVIGEHRVIFAGRDERITLGHESFSRALFAAGAVQAALWASAQPPGFYSIADVLDIDTSRASG